MGDDAKPTDITRALGKEWSKLKEDPEQLAIYTKLATDDKVRFDKDMETYSDQDSEEKKHKSSDKSSDKPSDKDKDKPKHPKTTYLFFCMEERTKIKEEMGEDAKASDVAIALGIAWNKLKSSKNTSDVTKMAELNKMAKDDKARYLSELSSYESAGKEELDTKSSSSSDPEEEPSIPVKKIVKGRGKQSHKKCGYVFFCQENRASIKTENPTFKGEDVTKKLSQMWKTLSEEERLEWKDRANE